MSLQNHKPLVTIATVFQLQFPPNMMTYSSDGLHITLLSRPNNIFCILLCQHVWVVGLDYNEPPSPRLTRRVPVVGTPTENEASGLISDKSSSKFSAEDLSNYLFLLSTLAGRIREQLRALTNLPFISGGDASSQEDLSVCPRPPDL